MSYSPSAYQEFDPENGDHLNRKKSLVRPERSRINPDHPKFHYTQVTNQESSHLKVQPSSTGVNPRDIENSSPTRKDYRLSNPHSTNKSIYNSSNNFDDAGIPLMDISYQSPQKSDQLPRGVEVYGLNDEVNHDDNNNNNNNNEKDFGRHKKSTRNVISKPKFNGEIDEMKNQNNLYFWKIYCYIVTFWAPPFLLNAFGLKGKPRQFAWREKMGLISCIVYLGAIIAFITFGFSKTVCGVQALRTRINDVSTGYLIINGKSFDLTQSQHPAAAGIPADSNVLYPPINAGGMDASLLFQNVNGNCKGLILPRDNCSIPTEDGDLLAWYMPCRLYAQDGSTQPNFTTNFYNGWACHTSEIARNAFYNLQINSEVYFTWDDIRNSSRNLIVYSGSVLDLNLINWISTDDVTYPDLFNRLRDDETFKGHDISLVLTNAEERQAARCLTEILKVGSVDSKSIGCIISDVVLYVLLIFILSVVGIKFLMACYYRWYMAGRLGATEVDNKSMTLRDRQIESWVDNPNPAALANQIKTVPIKARANYKPTKTNRQSVFFRGNAPSLGANAELDKYYDHSEALSKNFKYTTMSTQAALLGKNNNKFKNNKSARNSTLYLNDRFSSTDLLNRPRSTINPFEGFDDAYRNTGLSPHIIHPDVIPQPPIEYQPYGYPLAHSMILVTCYSEDESGLRLTLDSIATTDYPNSHKLIFLVCDGIIKGSGNDLTTPEIALSMMQDFCVPEENVKPFSYVSVAQGSKRHNMAKVYGGFYKYDDSTVPPEKQQRIPILTIVKCGTPSEASSAKPGNRGKRDSQIILMSFLQKVMFDERMTQLDFEILTTIWKMTGLMAEYYETVLMVDADTKIYPDSLTHMMAQMIKDPSVMGLCGETKIANKNESWVTLIQVFEYYISHHQAKAFETVFGGVTCLPGCFCMYRIKAPKGNEGYWVPILANPDIVERYSNNVMDTLHKKNLLLLGEDRYLSSLMLRTFPKRKQIFISKAACKTIVPNQFKVLLSQRRRWINSTVHNLMELVLVKDLCGTFCLSMQFVIFIELIGTLVLPAALVFTVYVIVFSIVSSPTPVLTLVLLAVIFGLPGTLIIITVSSVKYILYYFLYLLALPIWNFVLPSYAYWKFDDFSWGETRLVQGDNKDDHTGAEGVFDASSISMKRWREHERDIRNQEAAALGINQDTVQMPRATWDPANDAEYSGSGSTNSSP